MKKRKSLRKDTRGFTGLEAAIVLTAFVVVAAVFSYVVLNAGFFTSEKSKEVVHTGVEQVTSSFELAGNVVGHGWQYNITTKNQTLATITDPLSKTYGLGVTIIPDNNTMYVNATGVNFTTSDAFVNFTVKYKNSTGVENTTGWFNFTTNTTQSKTLAINVSKVIELVDLDSHNVTAEGSIRIYAYGTAGTYYPDEPDSTNLTVVELYLTLTAGQNPIDMDKVTIAYTDRDQHVGALNYIANASNEIKGDLPMEYWTYTTVDTPGATPNNLLEPMEEAHLLISLPEYGVTANKPFTLELKPSVGAVIEILRIAPGQIDHTMTLY